LTKNKNRQWILNVRPAGRVNREEFRWNETSIPQPSDGQVLVRNLWLSVDPAQRTWMMRDSYKPKVPLGEVMQSFAVGRCLNRIILTSSRATWCQGTSAGRTMLRPMGEPSAGYKSFLLACLSTLR
jgi:NADPH-dependent curcumin reductase CurA